MFMALVVGALCLQARADDKYLIHEKVRAGDIIPVEMTNEGNFKTTTTQDNVQASSAQNVKQYMKATLTVLTVKDGSATSASVFVDPSSYDIEEEDGHEEQKTSCWYAGKTVVLTRAADESVSNDAKGRLPPSRKVDLENLNELLSPDQDMFSDQPVSVGDSWDVSDKLSKHSDLNAGDMLRADCRLDWVKTINGKQMAQLTCVCGIIRYRELSVEEDDEYTCVMLVDVAAGQIVKADNKGTISQSTPAAQAMQVKGEGDFSGHCQVLPPATAPGPATRP
jgi:hypothetical protein